MPTQTINLLPMQKRTTIDITSPAVRIPSGVLAIELTATCTDYTLPAQTIALAALEGPTSGGTFTKVAGAGNMGGSLDENTGLLENKCGFRYGVSSLEFGTWARGRIQTVGAITFQLDLVITT